MKTHVVTTSPDSSLALALDLMDLYQVTSIPVIDELGRLLGILLEADIVREVVNHARYDESGNGGVKCARWSAVRLQSAAGAGSAQVSTTMITPAPFVSEDDCVTSIAAVVLQQGFERIPVVDDQQRVIGTLSRIDVCQVLFEADDEIDALTR